MPDVLGKIVPDVGAKVQKHINIDMFREDTATVFYV